MYSKHIIVLCIAAIGCITQLFAQDLVAENMLMFQRTYGGWSKHYKGKSVNYKIEYSDTEKAEIIAANNSNDATIDNEATTKEIKYLVKQYKKEGNKKYLSAAENGIRYLLKAQYKNGGWPQYYPDLSSYRHEITYNDNAMINVLLVLSDVSAGSNDFDVVDKSLIAPSAEAVQKGIQCILKTQVKVNGKLTVWCAQYDENTFKPAKARAYELPSLSGAESVAIVKFLMKVEYPSPEIRTAISAAVEWFKTVKIEGIKFESVADATTPKGKDRKVLPQPGNVLWARFYDIDTNKPFFCGRDGVKKKTVAEIEYERRNGYAWYGTWPQGLIETDYPKWVKKNG